MGEQHTVQHTDKEEFRTIISKQLKIIDKLNETYNDKLCFYSEVSKETEKTALEKNYMSTNVVYSKVHHHIPTKLSTVTSHIRRVEKLANDRYADDIQIAKPFEITLSDMDKYIPEDDKLLELNFDFDEFDE